jgi:hypothetical protein
MKVRAIGNASLGSDTQMQQALIGGAQEMMVGSTATLVGLSPEMAIWDTPSCLPTPRRPMPCWTAPWERRSRPRWSPRAWWVWSIGKTAFAI